MTTTPKVVGLLSVTLLAVVGAVLLGSRSDSAPAAAQASVGSALNNPATPAVARLGELQLSQDEFKEVLDGLPAEGREQLRNDRPALEGWLRARLAEKALLQQAQAQGWAERPEIQRLTRTAVEQIVQSSYLQSVTQVPAAYPSPAELQSAYDSAQSNLQAPALYRVKQIFLAVAAGQNEQQVLKQALELSRRAQAPNADFAALAKQYSQDRTSAEQGGDSGLLPLQQYVPQLRQVIVAQQVGNVSEPLRSNAGFHIVQLSEVQPSRRATLDEVRDALRQTLRNQRQEQIAKAYMEGLLNAATLSIDGPQLSQALEAQPAP